MAAINHFPEDFTLLSESIRLQNVARILAALPDNIQLTRRKKTDLNWARHLIGQIDWNSTEYERRQAPSLCVQATRLRPFFYHAVSQLDIPYNQSLSDGIYNSLIPQRNPFNPQAQRVLQSMSDSILERLQVSGRIAQA